MKKIIIATLLICVVFCMLLSHKEYRNYKITNITAENGGYPPTQNGDIRSLFWLFSLMALQN